MHFVEQRAEQRELREAADESIDSLHDGRSGGFAQQNLDRGKGVRADPHPAPCEALPVEDDVYADANEFQRGDMEELSHGAVRRETPPLPVHPSADPAAICFRGGVAEEVVHARRPWRRRERIHRCARALRQGGHHDLRRREAGTEVAPARTQQDPRPIFEARLVRLCENHLGVRSVALAPGVVARVEAVH